MCCYISVCRRLKFIQLIVIFLYVEDFTQPCVSICKGLSSCLSMSRTLYNLLFCSGMQRTLYYLLLFFQYVEDFVQQAEAVMAEQELQTTVDSIVPYVPAVCYIRLLNDMETRVVEGINSSVLVYILHSYSRQRAELT